MEENNVIIILTTENGGSFGRKIADTLHELKYLRRVLSVNDIDLIENYPPNKTLIHSRAAHPNAQWMRKLEELERNGYKVINPTSVLKLTSDKAECAIKIKGHPQTWIFNSAEELVNFNQTGEFIIKPEVSQGQGAFVEKFSLPYANLSTLYNNQPTRKVVVQRLINYSAIYRVICINGVALKKVFVDRPTPANWKVSVCLNDISMTCEDGSPELLNYAENIQKNIGGKVNFVDAFITENKYNPFVLSEINTACNLSIHERLSGINIHELIANYLIQEYKNHRS